MSPTPRDAGAPPHGEDLAARLRFLEEQNRALWQEKRQALESLELAASLVRFSGLSGADGDRHGILDETAKRVRTLVPCAAMGFWVADVEAGIDFQPALVDPEDRLLWLEEEVEATIWDGLFAWILHRNKPIFLDSRDGSARLLLHAMSTSLSSQGLCVAVLDRNAPDLPDSQLAILTILLHTAAHMLEGDGLARRLALANQDLRQGLTAVDAARDDLERQVLARTVDLAQAHRRLEEAFAATEDGIWEYHVPTRLSTCSPRWSTMLGHTPEEMDQVLADAGGWLGLLHPEDRDRVARAMQDYIAGDVQDYRQEFRMRHQDGGWRWILSRGKIVERLDGRALRVVGTHLDITARKRLEEELTQARDAADAASRAKSEFLGAMSHEIRTPLNGILGLVDLALMGPLDDERRDFLETARRQALSLLAVFNDILDLANIETRRLTLRREAFSVREMLQGALEPFQAEAQARRLGLTQFLSPDVPPVCLGDAARIRQVLFHLVGNAVKFTERGAVDVMVASLPQRRAGQGVAAPVRLLFAVRDSGVGIPKEKQAGIFQAFTQLDGSHARKHGGLGLGLALTRSLVELMGGQLWVSSVVGKGSVFSFTIPLEPVEI